MRLYLILLLLFGLTLCFQIHAEEPVPALEKVDVDTIKEKYWARGEESELGVVQNRLYTKENKFEFGLFGGFLTTDPFLNVKNAGGSFGFHFSEYFELKFMAWKSYVSPSAALQTFQDTIHATTNYNPPKAYWGGEGCFSIVYGKLSLLGQAIIYYDMHLLGGVGVTQTDSGNYITPSIGIGQQIYLSHWLSLRVDYRLMHYKETIIEKVISSKLGQPVGTRDNWTNSILLGFDFLFGALK